MSNFISTLKTVGTCATIIGAIIAVLTWLGIDPPKADVQISQEVKDQDTSQEVKNQDTLFLDYNNEDYSFNMILVKGGTFMMGASDNDKDAWDDEIPPHEVTLSSYYIGETEVTQELWQRVMGSNPSKSKGAKRPVECVSWNECQEFIKILNDSTGKKFRLPTEAEWEFAARGGNKSKGYKYSGSDDIDEVAWYRRNAYDKGETSTDYGTHDVKTQKPNELGLYDMSGNVSEWCNDWYEKYNNLPQQDPQGPERGQYRVYRGGGWVISAEGCRSSARGYSPVNGASYFGLRLVLSE